MNINYKNIDLIICNNYNKKKILKELSLKKEIYNIKFLTKEEFIKNYYFDIKEEAIYYLIKKYNIHIDIIKMYFKSLYFIEENKEYKNKKLIFLQNLLKELKEKKYLIYNDNFKRWFNNKKVKVIYNELEKYEEILLNTEYKIKEVTLKKEIYEYQTIEEEISSTAIKIIKLINDGVNINKIFISGVDEEYYYLLNKIFGYYQIPINIKYNHSIYGNMVVKKYLKTDEMELEKNQEIVKKILKIEEELVDLPKDDIYQKIFIDKLKETTINSNKLENAVNIINIYEDILNEDEHLFLLGINQDKIPKYNKDIDYITDQEKKEIKLYTTEQINKRRTNILLNKIKEIKNITLSYKLNSSFNNFTKSPIIDEYNLKIIKENKDTYEYSNIYNELRLCKYLDLYNLYQEKNNNLLILNTHYKINYLKYDNQFTGINIDEYKKNIKKPLNLSYTSLNEYNLSPFNYYLNRVLKLNKYEETFELFLGNLYHHLLMFIYEKDVNIEDEYNKFIEEKQLTNKEKILLKRLKTELFKLLKKQKQQLTYINFNNNMLEQTFNVSLNKEIKTNITGKIDKVLLDDKNNYAVIDYKTGFISLDLNLLKYGLNMQLPIYLYLINKNNEEAKFTGMYYQQVLHDYPNWNENNEKMNKEENDKFKLLGYSTSNIERLQMIDSEYEKSELIKSLSYKDNKFGTYSKILTDDEIKNIINYTDKIINESVDNILNANFEIKNKIYKGENLSSKYSNFKDILYEKDKHNIYLETVKDLSFIEGDKT